jgi:hypothetical protein
VYECRQLVGQTKLAQTPLDEGSEARSESSSHRKTEGRYGPHTPEALGSFRMASAPITEHPVGFAGDLHVSVAVNETPGDRQVFAWLMAGDLTLAIPSVQLAELAELLTAAAADGEPRQGDDFSVSFQDGGALVVVRQPIQTFLIVSDASELTRYADVISRAQSLAQSLI